MNSDILKEIVGSFSSSAKESSIETYKKIAGDSKKEFESLQDAKNFLNENYKEIQEKFKIFLE